MNGIVVVHHIIYLVISIALTVWVGRTLSKNGRIFWVNVFERNEAVADSINRLLKRINQKNQPINRLLHLP